MYRISVIIIVVSIKFCRIRPSGTALYYTASNTVVLTLANKWTNKFVHFVHRVMYCIAVNVITLISVHYTMGNFTELISSDEMYRHAPRNEVSVKDGPHIWRWSHNIIRYDMIYNMWYDMTWHTIWYMIWYDMILLLLFFIYSMPRYF